MKQLTCVTEIDHQQAPQRCVEGGPAPHVAQVGLVVYSQEGEVLALEQTQQPESQSQALRHFIYYPLPSTVTSLVAVAAAVIV